MNLAPYLRLAPTLLALAAGLACASNGLGRLGDSTPAPVERGAPLAGALASLSGDVDEVTRVSLVELSLLRMDAPPYPTTSPEDPTLDRGPVGVVARRSCRWKEGWRTHRVERVSWYLFENGALLAFEHTEFDPHCVTRRRYAPTSDAAEAERALARHVARQYPDSLPDAADRLRLGIALVDVDRLEESKKWLKDGQRALRRAEVDVEKAITDEERAEAAERRDELRQLRDTLVHKLERAEPTPEPPRRRFETQSLPGLDPAWPRPPDRSSEGSSER